MVSIVCACLLEDGCCFFTALDGLVGSFFIFYVGGGYNGVRG